MNTTHLQRGPSRAHESGPWLARAWVAVASLPVFFFIAFAVGEGLYAVLGYKPEDADAPIWVVLVALTPTVAVVLIPCVAAVFFGSRAKKDGDHRGIFPFVIGVIAGVGWLVLTVVSEVGNIVRK